MALNATGRMSCSAAPSTTGSDRIDEYGRRWVEATNPDGSGAPWDEPLTPTAFITYESARSTPMGEGCNHFPDFGDAICFFRFLRIPEELATTADEIADLGDLLRATTTQWWQISS